MKKKILIGWMIEGIADTIVFFKGAEEPFENHDAKKVRITIEAVK